MTARPQLMLNRKSYQVSKPEMEFHIINIIYAELSMRAQSEKTTFSCKDDYTLRKYTWGWTYSALQYLLYLYSVSLGDALTTAAVRPFFNHVWSLHWSLVTPSSVNYKIAMFLSSLESFVQIIPCFACWTHFQDSSVSGCRITNSKISSCDSWDFV